MSTILQFKPAADPVKAYFAGRAEHVLPTGEYEGGEEVLHISPEVAALLLLERIAGELSGREAYPQAQGWWARLKGSAHETENIVR